MSNLVFRSLNRMTQEEFARWVKSRPAGDLHHYELLDGFVVMEPPAGWPHGGIGALVVSHLQGFVAAKPTGVVCDSSQGFDLPSGDTVEPDAAFVSRERWEQIPPPVSGFLQVAPDLVVEVLSPSTRSLDKQDKRRIYESNGVREYWLIDPMSQSVRQLILGERGYDEDRVLAEDDTLESEVLAGLRIRVADLFPAFPWS